MHALMKTGHMNNETPEVTLQKLFDDDHFLSPKGSAYIGVDYIMQSAPPHYNSFGWCGGCFVVQEVQLKHHKFNITRDHQGFISVKVLDYCNFYWYNQVEYGKLRLYSKEVHDKSIYRMNKYMTKNSVGFPRMCE